MMKNYKLISLMAFIISPFFAIGQIDCSEAVKMNCSYSLMTTSDLTSNILYYNGEPFHSNGILEIQGSDQILEVKVGNDFSSSLDILIFEEMCATSNIIRALRFNNNLDKSYLIKFDANKKYYLNLGKSAYAPAEFQNTIFVNCVEPDDLNIFPCSSSVIDPNCNNTNQIVFNNSRFIDLTFSSDNPYGSKSVFTKIKGEGNVVTLESTLSGRFQVFAGSCNNLIEQMKSSGNIISFYGIKDQEYYINFDIIGQVTEPSFNLYTNCEAQAINDTCGGALNLTCDSNFKYNFMNTTFDAIEANKNMVQRPTQWYKLEGNDKTVQLVVYGEDAYYYLYESACDAPTPIQVVGEPPHNGLKFYAEPNKQYFIALSANTLFGDATFVCYDKSNNDYCSNAQFLNSDTTFQIPFYKATFDLKEKEKFISNRPTVWYNLKGNNKLIEFKLQSEEAFYYLFEGDDCTNPILRESLQEYYSNGLKFFAEENKNYFVAVSSDRPEVDAVTNYIDINENDSCSKPHKITCDTTFVVNTDGSLIGPDGKYHLWYEIKDINAKINLKGLASNIKIELYKNNCESIESRVNFTQYINYGEASFILEGDHTYFLHFTNIDNAGTYPLLSTITIDCLEVNPGDICKNAIDINCQQTIEISQDHLVELSIGNNNYSNTKWYKAPASGTISVEPLAINYNIKFFKTNDGCENLNNFDEGTENQAHIKRIIPVDQDEELYFMVFSNGYENSPSGSFLVSCDSTEHNFSCAKAVKVFPGKTYKIGGKSYENNANPACLPSDPGNFYRVVGNGKTHLFTFNFTPNNSESIDVYLAEGEACNPELTCLTNTQRDLNNNSFSFNSDSGKIYTLFIKARDFRHTTFEYNELNKIENTRCDKAVLIENNKSYFGLVQNHSETSFGCEDGSLNGLVYKVIGDGSIVRLSFNNINNYIGASLYEGNCSQNTCILSKQLYVYNNQYELVFTTKPGVEYLLLFENADFGLINFDAKFIDFPSNSICEGADFIGCDSSYTVELLTPDNYTSEGQNTLYSWYKLPDNKHIYTLTFENPLNQNFAVIGYNGTCAEKLANAYLGSDQGNVLVYGPGALNDNFISIGRTSITSNESIKFSVSCTLTPDNDKCNNAKEISCGQTFEANNSEAIFDVDLCYSNDSPDLWYSFIGDGKILKLKEVNFTGEYSASFFIYEGDPCLSSCIFGQAYTPNINTKTALAFKGEMGKKYFLKIQSSKNQSFEVACEAPQANDICSGAIPLEIGKLSSNYENLTRDEQDACMFFPFDKGQWFIVKDKSVIYDISSDYDFLYSIYTGDCANLTCLRSNQQMTRFNLTLNVEPDRVYYLALSSLNPNAEISISEREKDSNSICERSEIISCGDTAKVDLLRHGPALTNLPCIFNHLQSWYKIEGKNQVVKLSGHNAEAGILEYDILSNCPQTCPIKYRLMYTPDELGHNYYLKEGFDYFMRVSYPPNPANTRNPFIALECVDSAYTNVEKQFTIPLTCGDQIIEKSKISNSIYNTCFYRTLGTLFYSIPNSGLLSVSIKSRLDDGSLLIIDDNCNFIHNLFQNPNFIIPSTGKYYLIIVPNLTPNNIEFTVNLNCITPTLETSIHDQLIVSPNPFTNQINIQSEVLKSGKIIEANLYSITGELVFSKNINIQVDGSISIEEPDNLNQGIYQILLIVDNKRYYQKVIKIK